MASRADLKLPSYSTVVTRASFYLISSKSVARLWAKFCSQPQHPFPGAGLALSVSPPTQHFPLTPGGEALREGLALDPPHMEFVVPPPQPGRGAHPGQWPPTPTRGPWEERAAAHSCARSWLTCLLTSRQ